jgi:hypothetical protein
MFVSGADTQLGADREPYVHLANKNPLINTKEGWKMVPNNKSREGKWEPR